MFKINLYYVGAYFLDDFDAERRRILSYSTELQVKSDKKEAQDSIKGK